MSWEKRKIKERINRWVKKQGKEFRGKAGLGRVKGIWRTWAEIEREEQERANKGKEMNVEERERGRE